MHAPGSGDGSGPWSLSLEQVAAYPIVAATLFGLGVISTLADQGSNLFYLLLGFHVLYHVARELWDVRRPLGCRWRTRSRIGTPSGKRRHTDQRNHPKSRLTHPRCEVAPPAEETANRRHSPLDQPPADQPGAPASE